MAFLTLADLGRRMDPDGKIADMAELLSQCNEMIDDMPVVEANGLIDNVDPVQYSIRLLVPPGSYLEGHEAMLPYRGELDQAA